MRPALGKKFQSLGLNALISDQAAEPAKPLIPTVLPITHIYPNPKQPRRHFSEDALMELASSIKEKGILQPILVSPAGDGHYEIIAGERRWRAAQRAGLTEIPITIKEGTETERFAMALIENIQREDLNPIEQAEGYLRLQTEFAMTQEKIAEQMGKDRAVVANSLRLLQLPEHVRQALIEKKISAGHGRALAGLDNEQAREELFQRILNEKLPVRLVEESVREQKRVTVREHIRAAGYDSRPAEVKSIEEDLQRTLARKIELHTSGASSQKGWIRLEFYSLDDLDALIAQLKKVVA